MLAKESRFVNETPISGRMIATIGLNPKETEHPLAFSCSFGDCYTLELSDQKPNGSQKSGFDHIEILPVARSYESLLAQLQQKGISFTEVGRPHHTTHDHTLPGEFTLRLTREALLYKIGVEMQQLPWK